MTRWEGPQAKVARSRAGIVPETVRMSALSQIGLCMTARAAGLGPSQASVPRSRTHCPLLRHRGRTSKRGPPNGSVTDVRRHASGTYPGEHPRGASARDSGGGGLRNSSVPYAGAPHPPDGCIKSGRVIQLSRAVHCRSIAARTCPGALLGRLRTSASSGEGTVGLGFVRIAAVPSQHGPARGHCSDNLKPRFLG
jgi:hypothetical protein